MYKQLILNSATLPDSSNLNFRLNGAVTCYGFRVVAVCFTQEWDQFSSSNSSIAFQENGDTSVRTATIANGTYDSTSILTAVANALNLAGTQQYSVTYSDTSRRLTITASNKSFQFLAGSTAFLQLGLEKNANTTIGQTVTLPNPMNLSASNPILLTSRTLDNNGSVIYSAGINSDLNVLCCITLDNFQDVISWTNPDSRIFTLNGDTSLSILDFQLVDSSSLQSVSISSPVVITLGIFDDPADMIQNSQFF
jgi:hypothetical protein